MGWPPLIYPPVIHVVPRAPCRQMHASDSTPMQLVQALTGVRGSQRVNGLAIRELGTLIEAERSEGR
jgi:hypothetical protein